MIIIMIALRVRPTSRERRRWRPCGAASGTARRAARHSSRNRRGRRRSRASPKDLAPRPRPCPTNQLPTTSPVAARRSRGISRGISRVPDQPTSDHVICGRTAVNLACDLGKYLGGDLSGDHTEMLAHAACPLLLLYSPLPSLPAVSRKTCVMGGGRRED